MTVAILFVLNKLPMCVLHFLSDVLYFPVYYVARYRRKVVRDNLVKSFPEKSLKEIICIEKKFYHSLCDYFVEMVKYYDMSEKEIKRRMKFVGLEKLQAMLDKGHSCVLYMGHFLGYNGAVKLLSADDDEIASKLFRRAANTNKDLFFVKGSNRPRTVGELKEKISNKYTKVANG